MSNMSYCRFQNTFPDLEDCADAMDAIQRGMTRKLGREEFAAMCSLVTCAWEILQAVDLPDEVLEDPDRTRRALAKTFSDEPRT